MEQRSRRRLGSYRSAPSIYYGDMEGVYPADPASLTIGGKCLSVIPAAKTPNYHNDSSTTKLGSETTAPPDDAGGWIYDSDSADQNYGSVFVNCTHTDTKGTRWADY